MKKTILLFLVTFFVATTFSCSKTKLVVGEGSKTGVTEEYRQWYVLWGLLPVIQTDGKELVGDAQNYEYTTEATFLDALISGALIWTSFGTRTVKVTK